MRSLLARIRRYVQEREDRRWLDSPSGCCECGTGGPYYRGDKPPVTRYLYTGACHDTPPGKVDWSACSEHPIDGLAPLVDYGADVIVTFRQTEAHGLDRPR